MAKNALVINCDIRETRVALIEDGVIAELQIERAVARGTVGNIVLGKVTRVLPGMQAAFIDVGMDRAAFLHVEDLIRPDDFEEYLASDAREETDDVQGAAAKAPEDDEEGAVDVRQDVAVVTEDRASKRRGRRRGRRGGQRRRGRPEDGDSPDAGGDASVASGDEDEDVLLGTSDDDADLHDDDRGRSRDDESDDDDGDEVLVAGDDDARMDARSGRESDADDGVPSSDEDDDPEDDDLDEGEPDDAERDERDSAVEPEDDDPEDDDPEDDDPEDGEPELEPEDDDPEDGEPELEPEDDEPEDDEPEDDEPEDDDVDEEDEGELDDESELDAVPQGTARHAEPAADGELAEADRAARPTEGERRDESRGARAGGEPRAAWGEADAREAGDDRGGRRRRRRRKKRGGDRAEATGGAAPRPAPARTEAAPRARIDVPDRSAGKQRGKPQRGAPGGRRSKPGSRVSRSVPITEVVREGDVVVVQISKEPIGTKGARVTSHISLPGRYVVYLPTVEHVGISKRIGNARERSRLRKVMETIKPPKGGLIVRTVAEGLTKKGLKADVGYLIKLWADVSRKKEGARAPATLYSELDLVLKTARDLFTDEIDEIVIDDRDEYQRLVRFVEMFMPNRVKDIHHYQGDEPIFDAYGIEDEIARALGRKVPLPSGGYLIIDQAEALTAIDVNTGRYVGRGSKDLEETALKTNLEAVEEIAYQLRFRNIGGLVILDLIDMENRSNRERVYREVERALAKDKAKTTINRISDLGLIEMTRKRTRESLSRTMHEPCFYCDGTGHILSRVTIAYEILRQIGRERHTLPGYSVVVNAHPAIIDLLQHEERSAMAVAEKRFMRRIELSPRREYHIEQFDLQGK